VNCGTEAVDLECGGQMQHNDLRGATRSNFATNHYECGAIFQLRRLCFVILAFKITAPEATIAMYGMMVIVGQDIVTHITRIVQFNRKSGFLRF